jgi:sulfoxide reductase heme-binding subunit YedZ
VTVEQRYRWIYKPLVAAACLAPFVWLIARAATVGGLSLGPDPSRELLHALGTTALNLLWLTLLVSPARQWLRAPQLLRLRRMLGLFAFGYAALHFTVYAVLELELDTGRLATELVKRPYILIGSLGLLGMLPMAITSTSAMMRRLGRQWQRLHRLVYVVAVLVLWHFWWQTRANLREPLLYALLLAVLLGWRLWQRIRPTSKSAPARVPGRT